jgi:hypothetical protein
LSKLKAFKYHKKRLYIGVKMSIEKPRVTITHLRPGVIHSEYTPSQELTVLTPRGSSPLEKIARTINPFSYINTTSFSPILKPEQLRAAWEDVRDWYEALPITMQRNVKVVLDSDEHKIIMTPKSPSTWKPVHQITGAVSDKYRSDPLPKELLESLGYQTPEQITASLKAAGLSRA